MLTIFSTPKPFRGHIGVIQRNALKSWRQLGPEVEVILFGDEEGAAEAAAQLDIRIESRVERSPEGTKYLSSLFERAQTIARNDTLCYVNCDIVLLKAVLSAVQEVKAKHSRFLMVGNRWDLDITEALDVSAADAEESLALRARREGLRRPGQWIDYFVFSRGLYQGIPPLVIGRIAWDNWLVWRARSLGAAVVDASAVVTAVHQNHDYAYHPQGASGVWLDEVAQRNLGLAGGWRHLYTIDDATHALAADGLHRGIRYRFLPALRTMRHARQVMAYAFLGATRPLRHALGLRHENLKRLAQSLKLAKRG